LNAIFKLKRSPAECGFNGTIGRGIATLNIFGPNLSFAKSVGYLNWSRLDTTMNHHLRILVLTKRQYTNRDLLDDRFGRIRELPLQLGLRGFQVDGLCLSYNRKAKGRPSMVGLMGEPKRGSAEIARTPSIHLARLLLGVHADVIWPAQTPFMALSDTGSLGDIAFPWFSISTTISSISLLERPPGSDNSIGPSCGSAMRSLASANLLRDLLDLTAEMNVCIFLRTAFQRIFSNR